MILKLTCPAWQLPQLLGLLTWSLPSPDSEVLELSFQCSGLPLSLFEAHLLVVLNLFVKLLPFLDRPSHQESVTQWPASTPAAGPAQHQRSACSTFGGYLVLKRAQAQTPTFLSLTKQASRPPLPVLQQNLKSSTLRILSLQRMCLDHLCGRCNCPFFLKICRPSSDTYNLSKFNFYFIKIQFIKHSAIIKLF